MAVFGCQRGSSGPIESTEIGVTSSVSAVGLTGGRVLRLRITETEAYAGEGDTACHASRGRGRRSEMLSCR